MRLLTEKHYGMTVIEIADYKYAICHSDDTFKPCYEYVCENLWKIEAELLAEFCEISEPAIAAIQDALGHDANDDLGILVSDVSSLVQRAIRYYGGEGPLLADFDEEKRYLSEFIEDNPDDLTDDEIKLIQSKCRTQNNAHILLFCIE